MSSIKTKPMELDLVGLIVIVFGLANHEVTPWEAGRLASLKQGVLSDNPWAQDTFDHDEWARGFVYGCLNDVEAVAVVEDTVVVETHPVQEHKNRNGRSFWAAANNLQLHHGLSVDQLAGQLGVSAESVRKSMVSNRFYDGDGIPLGNRVAI